jgi:monoamine oxidase
MDTDVVVIGAGCAGLGAAAAVRAAGRSCVVMEASARAGGRAWTTNPAALGGVWFDMGAVWFHDAEHNPLAGIARAAGDTLLRSDEIRTVRTYVGGRLATAAERASYDGAFARYEAAADALLTAHDDVPLSAIAQSIPDDPWASTVEAWEGPVICVTEANRFSARDWRNNALGGSNLVPEGGIGAFVQRRCTAGLDIRYSTPATRIVWGGPGGRVSVETPAGTVTAGACIVTVSTGVLASGALRFEPPLPASVVDSVAALPMGLALKVALRATGPDRLDLPPHCSIDRQVARGETPMPFQCWPFGRDYVQGWIGGDRAWELARAGEDAAVDFALEQLRALFGSRVDRLFAGGGRLVTRWDADPWARGAYSYCLPGHAAARGRLAEPLADGHLQFAGEACHVPYASTVAGAWLSGQDAAGVAVRALASGASYAPSPASHP